MPQTFFFVEGADDELFLQLVVIPLLGNKGIDSKIIRTANSKPEKNENYAAALRKMGANIVWICDGDLLCPVAKRDKVLQQRPYLSAVEIQVVVCEIESWYFAGASVAQLNACRITKTYQPDTFTKESLNVALSPRASRRNVLLKLAQGWSVEKARATSKSFNRFYIKFLL